MVGWHDEYIQLLQDTVKKQKELIALLKDVESVAIRRLWKYCTPEEAAEHREYLSDEEIKEIGEYIHQRIQEAKARYQGEER